MNVNMKVKFVDSQKKAYSKINVLIKEEFIFSMLIKSLSVNFALKEDIDNVIKFIIVVGIAKINQKITLSVQYNRTTNKIIKVKKY